MEYAVFKSGGKQYKAKVGEVLELDKIPGEINKSIYLSQVLLWVSDASSKIGKPLVEGAKIKALVLEQKKGEKTRVAKFKAKSRYRKVIGFRPLLTAVRVEAFEIPGAKTAPKEAVKASPKTKKAQKTE